MSGKYSEILAAVTIFCGWNGEYIARFFTGSAQLLLWDSEN